jgi:tRNA(Ser,Leu) C12 N-acetylase TAN1
MQDWNVVATARDGCYRRARELLSSVCEHAERTHYKNVLIGRINDPVALLEALHGDFEAQKLLGRVVPLRSTFVFQCAEDLDEALLAAAAELAPELSGKSFHVRFHRRGFRGRVRSIDEEQRMDAAIVRATS